MASRQRPRSQRAQSSSWAARLFYPFVVLFVLLVGLVAFTVINGELALPFGGGVLFAFGKEESRGPEIPEGMVAVYGCPRALPAFTKITRDHLLTEDGLHVVPVPQSMIASSGLFAEGVDGLKSILGRVLRRDKPVNYAFTESDFLPKGTRPGQSAGIPPGKRAVWLNIEEVAGLSEARAGDAVDLVAATSVTGRTTVNRSSLGKLMDPVLSSRLDSLSQQRGPESKSWVIARNALVVRPVRKRELGGGSLGAKKLFVEEAFIAMAPDEVAKLTQAFALEASVVAAPRSGQPEDDPVEIQDLVPEDPGKELQRLLFGDDDSEPMFGRIEVIRGGQRETVTVPRAGARGED